MVRVYVRTGLHYDYPEATDFPIDSSGHLAVTAPSSLGLGEDTVAAFPNGNYNRAERLPAGTPPPDDEIPTVA